MIRSLDASRVRLAAAASHAAASHAARQHPVLDCPQTTPKIPRTVLGRFFLFVPSLCPGSRGVENGVLGTDSSLYVRGVMAPTYNTKNSGDIFVLTPKRKDKKRDKTIQTPTQGQTPTRTNMQFSYST